MTERVTYNAASARLVSRARKRPPKPCPCRCGKPDGLCDRHRRRLHEIMAGSGRRGYTIKGTQGEAWEQEDAA